MADVCGVSTDPEDVLPLSLLVSGRESWSVDEAPSVMPSPPALVVSPSGLVKLMEESEDLVASAWEVPSGPKLDSEPAGVTG